MINNNIEIRLFKSEQYSRNKIKWFTSSESNEYIDIDTYNNIINEKCLNERHYTTDTILGKKVTKIIKYQESEFKRSVYTFKFYIKQHIEVVKRKIEIDKKIELEKIEKLKKENYEVSEILKELDPYLIAESVRSIAQLCSINFNTDNETIQNMLLEGCIEVLKN